MTEETKEQKWMSLSDYKDKLKSEYFFKQWYMNHSLEWMDGFNTAMQTMLDILRKEE